MNIVCIIQARMGSSRLPGKVMLKICGKELLLHIVDRVLQSKKINHVVVATTLSKKDDVIIDLITGYKKNVSVERGSEEDVLDRYYQVARKFKADIIVRVTSDNPFVDPDIIDDILKFFEQNTSLDYASNNIGKHTFPRGLDVECFTFKALEKCWLEGKEPMDREHVTVYIKRSPKLFVTKLYENTVDLSHYRLTVDEKDDYLLAKAIYARIFELNPRFRMKDVVSVLDSNYDLRKINNHVKQKNSQY